MLELIIALAIVATLVVILLSGLRIGLSAWNRGEEGAEAHQYVRSLVELFQRSITSSYPYKARPKEGGEPLILFQGTGDSINFVTSVPPFPKEPSIAFTAVTVAFEQGEGGLVIRQKTLPNQEPFESTAPLLVDREVVSATFRYLNASGEWADAWNGVEEKKIPAAVEVEMKRQVRGKVEAIPTFIVPIRASVP
jgi:general secretion pathway protein J